MCQWHYFGIFKLRIFITPDSSTKGPTAVLQRTPKIPPSPSHLLHNPIMPSGAKKRKASKKKKKVNDSSTPNPHQGEGDCGELSSPTAQDQGQDSSVEVVNREDSSSEKKSNNGNGEGVNVEIETVSKSKNSSGSSSSSSDSSGEESHVVDKNVVVVESAPAVESLVEKISPVVEPVKPVDSSLEEVSQVCDEVKNEGKNDLVVEETVVVEKELTVDDCEKKDDSAESSVVVESVLKENEVEKVQTLVEKVSSESRDDVSSSTPPKEVISDVNGADCADEVETVEHSDRQAPVASTPDLAGNIRN
ncbi:hypothetical protein L1987_28867 [Smallanthus sonchifolius]|uniref:Uncharacterized protein n=1 Tax=Smallanthus sonchifolius TaxID=185202 RepID=A0ACB9I139_9ASTR|nr:hypothetical protein L1987_28867 [Smallanthus sonchifolius]